MFSTQLAQRAAENNPIRVSVLSVPENSVLDWSRSFHRCKAWWQARLQTSIWNTL